MTTQEKVSAISNELKKQVQLTEESLKETCHTLALMKNDANTYDQAFADLASVSVINHFILKLKGIIESGDYKKADNFIRFTCYQIEQFTTKQTLEADEPTGWCEIDAKVTVYQIFKTLVGILDA